MKRTEFLGVSCVFCFDITCISKYLEENLKMKKLFFLGFGKKLSVCDLGKAILCHIFTVVELFKSDLPVEVVVIVAVYVLNGEPEHTLLL